GGVAGVVWFARAEGSRSGEFRGASQERMGVSEAAAMEPGGGRAVRRRVALVRSRICLRAGDERAAAVETTRCEWQHRAHSAGGPDGREPAFLYGGRGSGDDSILRDPQDWRRLCRGAGRVPDLWRRRLPAGGAEYHLPELRRGAERSVDRRQRRMQPDSAGIARGRNGCGGE